MYYNLKKLCYESDVREFVEIRMFKFLLYSPNDQC
jgi:hypothetical protein